MFKEIKPISHELVKKFYFYVTKKDKKVLSWDRQ